MIDQSRKLRLGAAVLIACTAAFPLVPQWQMPAKADSGEDEKIIRQQATDYSRAYAAKDAATLAAMWTEDGSFTDSNGAVHKGRASIQSYFRDGFKDRPPQTLDIVVSAIKFPAPDVAVEEGTTRISSGPGMGSMGRYLVVHIRSGGKWLMSTCEETDCSASSSQEYLKDLGWMVGSWSVKGQPQATHLKVSWSKNKAFLLCRYLKPDAKEGEVEALQIIGWDPHSAQIVAWHFGAAGGFGNGRLTCDGKSWIEQAAATEPDGRSGRARYTITKIDDNTFTWQSSKRVIAGQPLLDQNPLTVVRDNVQ